MNPATTQYRQSSDTVDREQLILDHIDYARKIIGAMSITVRDEDARDNLHSAGMLGLIQAANSFDPNNHDNASFRTFSYPRIRGAILDELRKNTEVSQKVLKQIRQINDAYQQLEPPATPEKLARQTGLSLEDVTISLEAMRFLHPTQWVELQCNIHSSWNHNQYGPEYSIERSEMKEILTEGIEALPKNERLTLTLYYTEELTLDEIGQVIGLSESSVSRLLASAKFRMQEYIRSRTS